MSPPNANPLPIPGRVLLTGIDQAGRSHTADIPSLDFALELAGLYSTGERPWREWAVWGADPRGASALKRLASSPDE